MRLAIIIIAFDNEDFLERCIRSLGENRFQDFTIILVDNSLREGIGSPYAGKPGVYLLRSGRNLGFCEGNNTGIDKARELGAEFVFLLNHDTVVTAAFLFALSAALGAGDTVDPTGFPGPAGLGTGRTRGRPEGRLPPAPG